MAEVIVNCVNCNELTSKPHCPGCSDHGDCYSIRDVEEAQAEAADKEGARARISAWLDRELMLKDMPREVVPHFQRLIEDMEADDA